MHTLSEKKVMGYVLKKTFNGLLKFIGIQNNLCIRFCTDLSYTLKSKIEQNF